MAQETKIRGLRTRLARKDEIDVLTLSAAKAFKGRPMNDRLFPEHLRTSAAEPDEVVSREELDFRSQRQLARFDQDHMYPIIIVDDQDIPLGLAVWLGPLYTKPEESESQKAERVAKFPKGLDVTVLKEIESKTPILDQAIKDALGEDAYKKSWNLDVLFVDPAHQRKGVGRMLMQWGLDRAEQEHANLHLMSSQKGAPLYRSLGFEEVGSVELWGWTEYAMIKTAA